MKKIFSKIFCLALVVSTIMAFPSISALASDTPTTKKGFIPSDDSTWGDLYRYFDPEGFAALSPEEKQIYNSTLLDNSSTSTEENRKENYASSSSIIYPTDTEGHEVDNYASSSSIIYPVGNEDSTSSISPLGIEFAELLLDVVASTDSIDYTGLLVSTVPCPKLGIAVTLYDEDGIYVGFNADSDDNTNKFSLRDTFDGLESKTKYQVHGLALITPPPGYTASPTSIVIDCTTE